jgi:hypothetical protein
MRYSGYSVTVQPLWEKRGRLIHKVAGISYPEIGDYSNLEMVYSLYRLVIIE